MGQGYKIFYDVPLIPQDVTDTCWLASLNMLVAYHRHRGSHIDFRLQSLFDSPRSIGNLNRLNNTIPPNMFINVAHELGLRSAPLFNNALRTPGGITLEIPVAPDDFKRALQLYGPFIYLSHVGENSSVGGNLYHAVVINGLVNDGTTDTILYCDPYPPGRGTRRQQLFQSFIRDLQEAGFRIIFL